MLLLIIRTFIIYVLLFVALKLMGKRELAQLHPFELVVIFMISEMATLAMQGEGVPLTNSIVPIAVLTILQTAASTAGLKNITIRNFLSGHSSTIIKNGIVQEDALRKQRMSLSDLDEELRLHGCFNIAEIACAVVETNGQISIMPKAEERPVKTKDLELKLPRESPSFMLVQDGILNKNQLKESGRTIGWLEKQMHTHHIRRISEIFFAVTDESGSFLYQLKQKNNSDKK